MAMSLKSTSGECLRPELIRSPEEEGDSEQDCLDYLQRCGPVCGLIGEVCDRDHGEWKCAENVVRFGGKQRWNGIPSQQYAHAEERNDAEDDRNGPVRAIKTNIHTTLLSGQSERNHKSSKVEGTRW